MSDEHPLADRFEGLLPDGARVVFTGRVVVTESKFDWDKQDALWDLICEASDEEEG